MQIVWFSYDLRLLDNPAWLQALDATVLPIYIFEDSELDHERLGGASRLWLHAALQALNQSLQGRLNVYQGSAQAIIKDLLARYPVEAVHCNDGYEPFFLAQKADVQSVCDAASIPLYVHHGRYLWYPETVLKDDGGHYKVFSAYKRRALSTAVRSVWPTRHAKDVEQDCNAIPIAALGLAASAAWQQRLHSYIGASEDAAQMVLHRFLQQGLLHYQDGRNRPAEPLTSTLSPHLHFGTLSPVQVWSAVQSASVDDAHRDCFLSELVWRDFAAYLLYHVPTLPVINIQGKFDRFPWRSEPVLLQAWQQGQTGYPLVDAGMRQLWQTGTMHNRVRMVVASFLVKNLGIHWHQGQAWFWDCLFDADLASNSFNWQWVAGSGVDAAPYFRIFNPIRQAERFDPQGDYVRRFVPELAHLPKRFLHTPWLAPDAVLRAAGVVLGTHYPKPVVDWEVSRNAALAAYRAL